MKKIIHHNVPDKESFEQLSMEEKIMHVSSVYEVPSTLSTEEALNKLELRMETQKAPSTASKRLVNNRLLYWSVSVAASVLLIIGGYVVFSNPLTEVVSEKGSHAQYVLPDGSQVALNADSKITFNKKRFLKNRQLELRGEAFFKVMKGSSFVVKTLHGQVKVLGTSFNVIDRSQTFKVSCITGKVMVSSGVQSKIITPGESTEFTKDNLLKYQNPNIQKTVKWVDGEFYFEYSPISMVLEEIERQYNINFVGTKLENKFFTGSFTNKNLVGALDIVCIPMGLTYEIGSNGKVFIKESPK